MIATAGEILFTASDHESRKPPLGGGNEVHLFLDRFVQAFVFQGRHIAQANTATRVTRSSYFSSKLTHAEHEAHHISLSTCVKPFRSTTEMAEQPTTRGAESARKRYRRKQPRPHGTLIFCASFCASKMIFSFFGIKKATLASRQKTCR